MHSRSQKICTVNRMKSSFRTGGHSATLIENSSNINFYLFSSLNYKKELNRKHNRQLFFR